MKKKEVSKGNGFDRGGNFGRRIKPWERAKGREGRKKTRSKKEGLEGEEESYKRTSGTEEKKSPPKKGGLVKVLIGDPWGERNRTYVKGGGRRT